MRLESRQLVLDTNVLVPIASVLRAVVLTTDKDFAHLHPTFVEIEYVDPARLAAGEI